MGVGRVVEHREAQILPKFRHAASRSRERRRGETLAILASRGPPRLPGACFCPSHGDCCVPAPNRPLLWKDHLETIIPKTRSVWHGGAAISIPATTRSRGWGPCGALLSAPLGPPQKDPAQKSIRRAAALPGQVRMRRGACPGRASAPQMMEMHFHHPGARCSLSSDYWAIIRLIIGQ